jgi:hypothetical protein
MPTDVRRILTYSDVCGRILDSFSSGYIARMALAFIYLRIDEELSRGKLGTGNVAYVT